MREAFSRTYEAKFVREQPGRPAELRHYHPVGDVAGHDGRIVRITPHGGNPWLAMFAFGRGAGSDQLFSCPDPGWLCVVARNLAYLVNTRDPGQWAIVNGGTKITQVRPAEQANLLLFADLTDIEAWGPDGLAWRSARFSLDGLQHLRVEGAQLRGKGWYPEVWEEFVLDLRTGRHEGGPDLSLLEPAEERLGFWRRLLNSLGVSRR